MTQFEIKYGGDLPKEPGIRHACFFTIKHGEKVFSYEVFLGRPLSASWGNIKEGEIRLFLVELGLKETQEQLAKGNELNAYRINLTRNCPRPRLSKERKDQLSAFIRGETLTIDI